MACDKTAGRGPATLCRLTLCAVLSASCLTTGSESTTISINPGQTYQTFKGWEASMLQTVLDYKDVLPAFPSLLDMAASDLGITRLRVTVTPGVERPPDYGQTYLDGNMTERTLIQQYAYNAVNDNADPHVANLAGFEFALLDWRMENLIVPYQRRLAARGEKLYLYLSYTDFGTSSFEHYNFPDEYAEFMLVLFEHLNTKYGVVPDGINVMNEPDQTPWTAAAMGRVIAATGPRLAEAGYTPDFIIASTVDRGRAVSFFEQVIAVPGVTPFITDLSYHCYQDTGTNSWARIAAAGLKYGVSTMMNECWGSGNDARALLKDLKIANNSSWQQGPFNGTNGYYNTDKATMRATLNTKTKRMRQYYKYIRPGATRIEAASNDASFDPVAFINGDGSFAVVINATGAGAFRVLNLPAGIYDVSYSTAREFDKHRSIRLVEDASLDSSIPEAGVVTVTGPLLPSR